MRIKVLACKVLFREISLIAATCNNFIDVSYLKQGLHNTPDILQKELQRQIDLIDENNDLMSCSNEYGKQFDAIVLAYGLCSNGVLGLSSKKHKIIIPKAHDCITLLLGSKEKYKQLFDEKNGGIFWYTKGWVENTIMPGEDKHNIIYNEYVQKYGEDNAEFLMQMEQSWYTEYKSCTYIDWERLSSPETETYTKECAKYLNWEYNKVSGDETLLHDMLYGNWSEDKFTIIEPNHKIIATYDDDIIKQS